MEQGRHVLCLEFMIWDLGFQMALAAVPVDDDRLARLDPAAERFQGKIWPLSRPPDRKDRPQPYGDSG